MHSLVHQLPITPPRKTSPLVTSYTPSRKIRVTVPLVTSYTPYRKIRQRVLPEGVRPLVPAELASDAVGNGGDKLSTEAQLRAQLQGKGFRGVVPLGHVPLKLVHQRDVPHVDVQLSSKHLS